MEQGTIVVIGLCLFLGVWYGAGHLFNLRRGQQLFQWLEAGLDVLGGEREGDGAGGTDHDLPVGILRCGILL